MTTRVTGEPGNQVTSLIGVYDAEGTLAGELRYWIGAHLTGSAHCALCEITHGLFREKAQWRDLASALPAPFEAVHLDERPADVIEASDGRTPCVLARRADNSVGLLMGPEELEAMGGDPARLAAALGDAIRRGYPSDQAPT